MTRRRRLAAIAAAAGLIGPAAWAARADAAVLVATYTGTVSAGDDLAGLFGAAGADLTGQAYVARYTVDTAVGLYALSPGSVQLYGGSHVAAPAPVSASLTINGHTQTVSGDYSSGAFYQTGTLEYYAEYNNGYAGNHYIDTYIESFTTSIPHPALFAILPKTSTDNVGQFQLFDYVGSTGVLTAYAIGLDSPGTLQISPAPEPAAWTLMLVGVAGAGLALRGVRRGRVARGV